MSETEGRVTVKDSGNIQIASTETKNVKRRGEGNGSVFDESIHEYGKGGSVLQSVLDIIGIQLKDVISGMLGAIHHRTSDIVSC